jgi:hypothetical protein
MPQCRTSADLSDELTAAPRAQRLAAPLRGRRCLHGQGGSTITAEGSIRFGYWVSSFSTSGDHGRAVVLAYDSGTVTPVSVEW